ncbi:MAG: ATP-binding cassette domain-containing protein, partial [Saprospiraceae bacterium]|nr:ATP-binding cassette domain-containing protein [Saprospiraceae bacterium]
MSNEKIIFSMMGVSKVVPPNKMILKDIYLSFFYGAKIGVLGLNGAGKSTLLRIIAGIDKNYQGNISFQPGFSVGFLEQEPAFDPTKTVRQIVEEGVQELVNIMKEYEEVNLKFSEPLSDAEMDKLITRQGELMDLIDQHNGWELDHKLERAMDALRCPESDALISNL